MRDASEYRYSAGERRVTVRASAPMEDITNLAKAADKYLEQFELFLGTNDVRASSPTRTGKGAEVITVSAQLPDGRQRTALLRFPNGPLIELSLTASLDDAGIDSEFSRLLASAEPTHPDPTRAVAHALTAGSTGAAGPLRLDLTGYTAHVQFALESDDGRQRYQFLRSAEPATIPTRSGLSAPELVQDIGHAIGADGRPVQFERHVPKRFDKSRAPGATMAPSFAKMRGSPGEAVDSVAPDVTGSVQGVELSVHLSGADATPEKARQLLRELENAN